MTLTAYDAWVRRGYFGRGNQIRISGVTAALLAISKTIKLAGYISLVYRGQNRYNLAIEHPVEGWCRQDPLAIPELAVPVTVPTNLAEKAYADEQNPCASLQAMADLALIAFHYLLCIGEYTKPRFISRNGKKSEPQEHNNFGSKTLDFLRTEKSSLGEANRTSSSLWTNVR